MARQLVLVRRLLDTQKEEGGDLLAVKLVNKVRSGRGGCADFLQAAREGVASPARPGQAREKIPGSLGRGKVWNKEKVPPARRKVYGRVEVVSSGS